MLADLKQGQDGYTARFDRYFNHSVGEVWAFLTEDDKLKLWFPELSVGELREGGFIKFDMGDGKFEKMGILELKPPSVLEYTWGKDRVRFELAPESGGCRLFLIETLHQLTAHTPKDLAGWHVCLDVVGALLDGRTIESRETEWKAWYESYQAYMPLAQHQRMHEKSAKPPEASSN